MMNKKIDIDKFEKRTPFSVPENYFSELKSEIQDSCKTENKSYLSIFQYAIPFLGISLIMFYFFTNTGTIFTTVSEIELSQTDLIAYLEEDISDDLLYEYIYIEDEETDELSEEIDYLLDYNMDYNLIINQL